MHITLRQLQVFQHLAQGHNFSQTGTSIGLTQPAVSRSMVELEAQLGVRLLDRTTREVLLTEAGELLAQRIAPLLQELDDAFHEVADLGHAARGTVRVASSPTLSAALMPPCIAACAAHLPEVRLQLVDRLQQDVLAQVRSGEVHFGVVVEPSDTGDLDCETLLHDPFVLVCPAQHALAREQAVSWPLLRGSPLVLLDHASGSRRLMDAVLAEHGCGPETCPVVQEVGHVTTAFRMVEAGIGLSVMPGQAIPPAGLPGLAVRPLAPERLRAIMLVRRRQRSLSSAADKVWAIVRQCAQSLHAGTGGPCYAAPRSNEPTKES
ncbi:LysR family transcriptional regulator [Comamonas humi]